MDWRRKYRPYIAAACLAFIFTMFFAPEMNEGSYMDPTLKDGQAAFMIKQSYSAKRDQPKIGTVVCLEKIYSRATSDDNIIGRVQGLPGDTIQIKAGKIYRNGEVIADAGMAKEQTIKLEKNDVYILSESSESDVDSRNPKLGVVDMREIKGNLKLIVWPLSDFGLVK